MDDSLPSHGETRRQDRRSWRASAPFVAAALIAVAPPPSGLPQHTWYYFALFVGVVVALVLVKDRNTGSWWPLFHWTDSKIRVHGLYCTIALLLRALAYRRVRQAGVKLSKKRMLSELNEIREVVNFYPRKRRQKVERKESILTKTSEVQQKLISILGLQEGASSVLG